MNGIVSITVVVPFNLDGFFCTDSKPKDFAHQHSTPNTPASVYLKPQPRRATHQGLSYNTSTTDKEDDEVAAINTAEGTVTHNYLDFSNTNTEYNVKNDERTRSMAVRIHLTRVYTSLYSTLHALPLSPHSPSLHTVCVCVCLQPHRVTS